MARRAARHDGARRRRRLHDASGLREVELPLRHPLRGRRSLSGRTVRLDSGGREIRGLQSDPHLQMEWLRRLTPGTAHLERQPAGRAFPRSPECLVRQRARAADQRRRAPDQKPAGHQG